MASLDDVMSDIQAFGVALKAHAQGTNARIAELEQKIVRRAGEGGPSSFMASGGDGLGRFVLEHAETQRLIAAPGRRGRAIVGVGAMLGAITTVTAGATRDVLVAPDRRPDIVPLAQRRLTIRALLQATPTTSNAIQYPRETGFTNNASVVSEGELKAESRLEFELVTAPVQTIAHVVIASKQILDDAAQLQNFVDGRLRYGVSAAEEEEILYGDGTGVHLHGLVPQATAFSAPFVYSGATRLDILAQAIAQVEAALYPVTGMVLNSLDGRELMLIKDSQGRYVGSGPFGTAFDNIWGIPVVYTPALTAGKFLVGAFGLAANLYDRQEATVEISTEDSDNFRRNLVTLRGEERVALTVSRPEAMVYGDY